MDTGLTPSYYSHLFCIDGKSEPGLCYDYGGDCKVTVLVGHAVWTLPFLPLLYSNDHPSVEDLEGRDLPECLRSQSLGHDGVY